MGKPESLPLPNPEHEMNSEEKLDVAVVFGEGPNLPVLLPDEITSEQEQVWKAFTRDPQHQKQPDFYLLSGNAYTTTIEEIANRSDISHPEKQALMKQKRFAWQHTGRFALRRIGRLNALAAGDALLERKVEKLILSGGRTIPAWKREEVTAQYLMEFPEKSSLDPDKIAQEVDRYLKYSVKWPSEAELMQDVIIKSLGWNFFSKDYSQEQLHLLFTERFGKPVDEANSEEYKVFEKKVYHQYIEEKLKPRLLLEDDSMNTLDNIVMSTNRYPEEMVGKDKKIGLFASDWQRSRALLLAERFLIHVDQDAGISSQRYLRERALKRKEVPYVQLMDTLMSRDNPPIADVRKDHARLLLGLTNEAYANYWTGWLFKVQDPQMFVDILHQYKNPKWVRAMSEEFSKVGLNFEQLQEMDLLTLADTDPLAYQHIMDKGLELTKPKLRNILPPLHEMQRH